MECVNSCITVMVAGSILNKEKRFLVRGARDQSCNAFLKRPFVGSFAVIDSTSCMTISFHNLSERVSSFCILSNLVVG